MNRFVQGDPMLCIGCRTCMIGCVVAHEGLRIFEINPDSYDFHPKLKVVKTYNVSVPVQCKHCENPACLSVCKSGAITRVDGTVSIDREKCIGCKSCTEACPFGAIEMVVLGAQVNSDNTPKVVANKCDLCKDVPAGPTCLRVCPTAALRLVTEGDMSDVIRHKRLTALQSSLTREA